MKPTDIIARNRITAPHRSPDLIPRPHLIAELERMIDTKRLSLVSAPAGYGKSSLLADWGESTSRTVCWYAVDGIDNELQRFLIGCIAAVRQQLPDFGRQTERMVPAYVNQETSTANFVSIVVNDLLTVEAAHIVLVIDDFQLIDSPSINEFVAYFVQQAPPNFHLVLTTRDTPHLHNLSLLIARSLVGFIDEHKLAFSTAEVQDLARHRFGRNISVGEAETLVKSTEGWITGILFSVLSTPLSGRLQHAMRKMGVTAYDYLADEVYNKQPQELRLFLMRVAPFHEYCAELCQAVFPAAWLPHGQSWQQYIDTIIDEGLFISLVGDAGRQVRFHALFREFLLARLAQERPEDEQTILHRYGAWLQAHQRWEHAYSVYQQLQDHGKIAELIGEAGLQLLNAGRAQLLEQWIGQLPDAVLASRPDVQTIDARAKMMLGRTSESARLYARALCQLSENDGLWYLRAIAWRSSLRVLHHQFETAISECNYVLSIIGRMQHRARVHATTDVQSARGQNEQQGTEQERAYQHITAFCYDTLGECFMRQRRLSQSIEASRKALELYEELGNDAQIAKTSYQLRLSQAYMGHLKYAGEEMQTVTQSVRDSGNLHLLSDLLYFAGMLHHWQGKFTAAATHFTEGIELARKSLNQHALGVSYLGWGRLLADAGMLDVSDLVLANVERIAQTSCDSKIMFFAKLDRAYIAALNGREEDAQTYLDQAVQEVSHSERTGQSRQYKKMLGIVLVLAGKPSKAIEPLSEFCVRSKALSAQIELLKGELWLAAAYQATGQSAAAAESFTSLLHAVGQINEYTHIYADAIPIEDRLQSIKVAPSATRLATHFFSQIARTKRRLRQFRTTVYDVANAEIRDLLRQAPESTPTYAIRALGKMEVAHKGAVINRKRWMTVVSRDILFCLLAHPSGLTREEIGVMFWPDASYRDMATRFKNAIYRLRSAVGSDIVLYDDGVYRFNRETDYMYDVEQFLHHLDRLRQHSNPNERIQILRNATACYQGAYCPDLDLHWAQAERQRLENLYRNALMDLATLHYETRDMQAALDVCNTMIAMDNCWEDPHRLAMLIHADLGHFAEVVRQYDTCKRTLVEELGVHPSAETQQIYRQLLAQLA